MVMTRDILLPMANFNYLITSTSRFFKIISKSLTKRKGLTMKKAAIPKNNSLPFNYTLPYTSILKTTAILSTAFSGIVTFNPFPVN